MILITFKANSIFLCLLLHLSELTNDMHATMIARMNSHNKPCKAQGKKQHTNVLYYYPGWFITQFHSSEALWLCFIRCGFMIYAKL